MKGVIFDFNGTRFFDEKFQNKAWRTFIEHKIGRDLSDYEFKEYVHGKTTTQSVWSFIGTYILDGKRLIIGCHK